MEYPDLFLVFDIEIGELHLGNFVSELKRV
jgi:hypothetical protein